MRNMSIVLVCVLFGVGFSMGSPILGSVLGDMWVSSGQALGQIFGASWLGLACARWLVLAGWSWLAGAGWLLVEAPDAFVSRSAGPSIEALAREEKPPALRLSHY